MDKYLEFNSGITNLILTAPHAGNLKPKEIPRRKYGKLMQDTSSGNVTRYMVNYTTNKPYYIIANIHRSRVDLNRDIVEGAQGNLQAKQIWKLWYKTLADYVKDINGKLLYVDIHSHNNSDEFQLGYNLNKEDYYQVQNERLISCESSLKNLNHNLYEMLFGKESLKVWLEQCGYKVYNPKPDEVYFNGGRNIEVFSKLKNVGAIQVEIPVSLGKHMPAKIGRDLLAGLFYFKHKFVDN